MFAPPSLPRDIVDRSFVAQNGEFGIKIEDAAAFLNACDADCIELLGWELWLVDHAVASTKVPHKSEGNWSGLIPTIGDDAPSVIGGEGDLEETRRQIAACDF